MTELPPPDEHAEDLFWNALNYRTAATQHAEAMWRELEICVSVKIWAAVLAEREACAKLCKEYANRHAKDDDNSKAQAWMMLQCAAAIRARGE